MKSREISGQITMAEYLASLAQEKEETRKPVRKPREPFRISKGSDIPEDVQRALLRGAGRPGARIHIAMKVEQTDPLSFIPIRTAIEELAGAQDGGVLILHRGIRSSDGHMVTWPAAMDFIRQRVSEGTWLSGEERARDLDAYLGRSKGPCPWIWEK